MTHNSPDYFPHRKEVLNRLQLLYDRREQDHIFACMEIPSATIKQFALKNQAGFCEYPDPQERIRFWDAWLCERAAVFDDSVPAAPLKEMDQGLYGGILGGEVSFLCDPSLGKISSMVKPVLSDWNEFESLSYGAESEWFQRYLNQLEVFVQGAGGRYGISHLIMIDGLNFVFELFGATKTYLDLFENPDKISKAIDFAYDLNLFVQNAFFQTVPLLEGGTCSDVAMWIKGRIVSESLDPFHLTSVDCFEEWGREPAERIIQQFDGGIIHIHGNGRHLLQAVSSLQGLKAIFLGDDRGYPLAFDVLKEIKQKTLDTPLILKVDFKPFCDAMMEHRLFGGVLYRVQNVPDTNMANYWMEKVRSYTV